MTDLKVATLFFWIIFVLTVVNRTLDFGAQL